MKKILFLVIIFISQFGYSENISLVCSLVAEGKTSLSDQVFTFDTESKDLKTGSKIFSLLNEPNRGYQWVYKYKVETYDVEEYYTLNRTTLFMGYFRKFGTNFSNKQGQCYKENPQI